MNWQENQQALGAPSAFGLGAPAPILADGIFGETLFEVGNTFVRIYNAPPYLQQLLDFHTRYPTEVALHQQDGWRPPEAFIGEDYWDGWVHLTRFPVQGPGITPTGLLDLCKWVCARYSFPFQVLDEREVPLEDIPQYHHAVVDRDYQLEAVRRALDEGRGVLDMPPRSGKTRTGIEIHRCISLPTIWVAPTTNIVKQTVRAFEELFGANYACHLVGGKKWRDVVAHRVVICTAATARDLPPEFFATRDMLFIDEFHHAAAKTYHELVAKCPNIYYRFGMTGTFFRSGTDVLAMHGVLSKTIYKVTAEELVKRGYLVPTDVCYLPVDGPKAKGGPTFQTGCGKYGIYQHEHRTNLAIWAAQVLVHYGRKVLVLVGTKEQGRNILEGLEHTLPTVSGRRFQSVEFVSTDRRADLCQAIIDSFVQTDTTKVLIGTSMVGEGTDLPTTDACVYCPGQKAEVPLIQAAYRVCTAMEGKTRSIFVDFSDRHHRTLMEHSLERLAVFWKEATFNIEVLDDAAFFGDWVANRPR